MRHGEEQGGTAIVQVARKDEQGSVPLARKTEIEMERTCLESAVKNRRTSQKKTKDEINHGPEEEGADSAGAASVQRL